MAATKIYLWLKIGEQLGGVSSIDADCVVCATGRSIMYTFISFQLLYYPKQITIHTRYRKPCSIKFRLTRLNCEAHYLPHATKSDTFLSIRGFVLFLDKHLVSMRYTVYTWLLLVRPPISITELLTGCQRHGIYQNIPVSRVKNLLKLIDTEKWRTFSYRF